MSGSSGRIAGLLLSSARATAAGVLRGPCAAAGCRQLSSHTDAIADDEGTDDGWWHDVQGGGGEAGGGSAYHRQDARLNAPIDAPRGLEDFRSMVTGLMRRKRAYLIRDVIEEMSLNGVRPDAAIMKQGLFACMKNRKLGDAMWFFEEMQRRGMEPDAACYSNIISACGRSGQVARAVELRDEMLARGLELDLNTRLALLHAYSEAGKLERCSETFEELRELGHRGNEYVYAGLLNCFRHMNPRLLPPDTEPRVLSLVEQYKEEVRERERLAAAARDDPYLAAAQAAALPPPPRPHRDASYSPLLVVYNAALNTLAETGHHNTAKRLYAQLQEDGLEPNSITLGNMIRSHLQLALGKHKQPSYDALTALLDEQMRSLDLKPDMEAVLEEDPDMAAALAAAEAQRDTQLAASASARQPEVSEEDEGPALDAVVVEEEEEEEAQPAALRELDAGRVEAEAALVGADGRSPPERPARRPGSRVPYPGQSLGELRRVLRERACLRARSRLRFREFRAHLDLDAWYEALHLFQEVLDRGVVWGPTITYTMLKAALDLQAAGVEDAMAVGHAVMDAFDRQGLFVDVDNGSEVLLLAVRRDVGDLSLAHRVYDAMRATQRVPKTPAMFKYMRALVAREPQATERLIELCTRIVSDPDRSDRIMPLKREAFQRRQALLDAQAPAAAQGGRQAAQ